MKFEEFQNECAQIKHHHKNHKERIPRAIQELVEKILQHLYNHIESRDRDLYQKWKFGSDFNGKKTRNSFDSLRFNLQELFEIYSRVSPQRNQRSTSKSKNSQGQIKQCPADSGLYPINTYPLPKPMIPEELRPHVYFQNMKKRANLIMDIYLKNYDIIEDLSHKKSTMYKYMMQGMNQERECQNVQQKLIRATYCEKMLSYNEILIQKRALGDWLAQGDFFAENNGTSGFRKQESLIMSSLTFKGNRDKSNPSNNSLKKRERAVKSRQDSVHSFINSNDAQKEVLEVEKEEKSRQKQFIVQFINKRQSKYEKKKKHMRKVKMHRIKHST